MPNSIYDPDVQAALSSSPRGAARRRPLPSPADWRDEWIYFLMLDRFNNPMAAPNNLPFDAPFGGFQGGTYRGVIGQAGLHQGTGSRRHLALTRHQEPRLRPDDGTMATASRTSSPSSRASPSARPMPKTNSAPWSMMPIALGLYVILDIVLHHAGDVFE